PGRRSDGRPPRSHPAPSREKARNKVHLCSCAEFYRYHAALLSGKHAARMPAMRFPRPKSLSGLMLIGFTIVAAPLLFAIVNAAVQMNRLSTRSEQLVVHGVRATRNNQRVFEEIGALERTARLYQIIGNADLLDVYAHNHDRLIATVNELLGLPLDAET